MREQDNSTKPPNQNSNSTGDFFQIRHEELIDRLGATRKALKLTQKDIAERFSCNRAWVASLEQGRGIPTLDYVSKMAKESGESIDYFVFGPKGRDANKVSETVEELEMLEKFRTLDKTIQRDLLKQFTYMKVLNDNYVRFKEDVEKLNQKELFFANEEELEVRITYAEISKDVIIDKTVEVLNKEGLTATAKKVKAFSNLDMTWKEFIGKVAKYVRLKAAS